MIPPGKTETAPPVSPPTGGDRRGGADEVDAADLSAVKLITIPIFTMNSLAIFIANS